MSKIIEITVSPKGEATVQTKGFTGESCRTASHHLEKALGLRTGERMKSEFYSKTEDKQVMRQ